MQRRVVDLSIPLDDPAHGVVVLIPLTQEEEDAIAARAPAEAARELRQAEAIEQEELKQELLEDLAAGDPPNGAKRARFKQLRGRP